MPQYTLVPRTKTTARALLHLDPSDGPPDIGPPDDIPGAEPAPGRAVLDLPAALLRLKQQHANGQSIEQNIGQLLTWIEEYIRSPRICVCGGQIDRSGVCWACIERAEQLAAARLALTIAATAVDERVGF